MALPIPAPRAEGWTTTTDVPLYWCRHGRDGAPPILVLHGGPGAHHDYLLPHFLDLADEFDLLFYDQRGGGRSKTDDPAPITAQVQVDDLERVIAELTSGPLTIVAYSWGALLALLYAIDVSTGRRRPMPARLALVDPAPISRTYRAAFEAEFARRANSNEVQAMRAELAASGLRDREPAAYRQRAFELSVAAYFHDPGQAANLTPFRVTGRVQQQVWDSLGDFDLTPMLAGVHTDVLVVHGREDPIPVASSAAVADAMRAQFVVLDGCGHVPYVERRDAFFSTLRSFVRTRLDRAAKRTT